MFHEFFSMISCFSCTARFLCLLHLWPSSSVLCWVLQTMVGSLARSTFLWSKVERWLTHAFAIFLSHSIHAGLRSLERQIRQGMKSCVTSLCREGLHQPHQVCMTNHTCVCNKGVPTASHKTSYSDPDARIFGSDLRVSINAITVAFGPQKWVKRKLQYNHGTREAKQTLSCRHFSTSIQVTCSLNLTLQRTIQ